MGKYEFSDPGLVLYSRIQCMIAAYQQYVVLFGTEPGTQPADIVGHDHVEVFIFEFAPSMRFELFGLGRETYDIGAVAFECGNAGDNVGVFDQSAESARRPDFLIFWSWTSAGR